MVEIARAGAEPCPKDKIAVAILGSLKHCGLTYPTSTGAVELCDLQNDYVLRSVQVPDHYYWTVIELLDHEVQAVAELLEMVLTENPQGLPYSLVYSPDALSVTGKLRSGAGFTCSTYVLGILDALSLPFVDVKTWEARPKEDGEFKNEYLEGSYFLPKRLIASGRIPKAEIPSVSARIIRDETAARIQFEEPDFRIKPAEICGAATVKKYPVNFQLAKNRAVQVAKKIKQLDKK